MKHKSICELSYDFDLAAWKGILDTFRSSREAFMNIQSLERSSFITIVHRSICDIP